MAPLRQPNGSCYSLAASEESRSRYLTAPLQTVPTFNLMQSHTLAAMTNGGMSQLSLRCCTTASIRVVGGNSLQLGNPFRLAESAAHHFLSVRGTWTT